MEIFGFRGPAQDICLNLPKAIEDHASRWTLGRFIDQTIDAQLDKSRGTTRVGAPPNLVFVDRETRRSALERVVIGKFAAGDFAENDAERIYVSREIEFVAEEDFG